MSDSKTHEPNATETALPSAPDDAIAGEPWMNRRRFMSSAAAGAAGLALALNQPESAFAQQQETGEVVIDAMLVTILAAPVGSQGSTSWTVTQSFASTFSLTADANRTVSLGASVTNTVGNETTGTFSLGTSTTYVQSRSVQVTDAITIRSTISFMFSTPVPGVVGNTLFFGISKPRVNFKGNPSRLLWKFLNSPVGELLVIKASDLQTPVWESKIRASTRSSWLSQYPLLTDPSGSTLVKPRFKKRYIISVSAGAAVSFSVETAEGSSFSLGRTASSTSEIIESTGFSTTPPSGGGPTTRETFQVGQKLTLTLTSVQEVSATRIIRFSTLLQRTTPGTFVIYKDKVFKTWLVVDAGPPVTSGQPVVRGVINGASGGAVAGAVVRITQGTQEYIAAADGTGNYVIATPSGQPMATGNYPIVSGDVNQYTSVTSGTSYSNFYGVDGASATSPEYVETAAMLE